MPWIPTVEYIIEVFRQYIEIPVVLNRSGLMGTVDRIQYGSHQQQSPMIWEQVTILYRDLVENHYFMDGNKRIGMLIAVLFLNKNGFEFSPPSGEIFSHTMAVAQNKLTVEQIQEWFKRYSHAIRIS